MRYKLLLLLQFSVLVVTSACTESESPPKVNKTDDVMNDHKNKQAGSDHRAKISEALTDLLQRENDDAFVIFQEKHSGKFVQFAGSAKEGLFLDLPFQTLNEAEDQRAAMYFVQLGVHPKEYDLLDGPGGKTVGRQRSFQKEFGKDIETASRVTLEIFEQVYCFPQGFELIVEKNRKPHNLMKARADVWPRSSRGGRWFCGKDSILPTSFSELR